MSGHCDRWAGPPPSAALRSLFAQVLLSLCSPSQRLALSCFLLCQCGSLLPKTGSSLRVGSALSRHSGLPTSVSGVSTLRREWGAWAPQGRTLLEQSGSWPSSGSWDLEPQVWELEGGEPGLKVGLAPLPVAHNSPRHSLNFCRRGWHVTVVGFGAPSEVSSGDGGKEPLSHYQGKIQPEVLSEGVGLGGLGPSVHLLRRELRSSHLLLPTSLFPMQEPGEVAGRADIMFPGSSSLPISQNGSGHRLELSFSVCKMGIFCLFSHPFGLPTYLPLGLPTCAPCSGDPAGDLSSPGHRG